MHVGPTRLLEVLIQEVTFGAFAVYRLANLSFEDECLHLEQCWSIVKATIMAPL